MDDTSNGWHGKELHAGAYIRHGVIIKYQCQCLKNCTNPKSSFVQCLDGQWTHGGPFCREGNSLRVLLI